MSNSTPPAAGAQGSAPAPAVRQPSWLTPTGPAGLKLTVMVQHCGGRYAGAIEQLPGCSAEGPTLDALVLRLVAAIANHPDAQREIGDLASAPHLAELSRLELFIPRFA